MDEAKPEGQEPQIIHVTEEDLGKTFFPLEVGRETVMIIDESTYVPSN
jgi:hypothetical protein